MTLARPHCAGLPSATLATLAVLATFALALPADAQCIDPPPGVTGWWGGDGNAGDVYGAWNGQLVGAAGFGDGLVGDAFAFDGSGARVDVTAAGAGELGSAPFTIDLWFNSDASQNGAYLIGKSHPDGGQGWDIRVHQQRIALVGFNGWAVNLQTDPIVVLGQWHHLAVTSDGATVTLYFDGATDPAWTIARQTISSTGNPLRFGDSTNFGGDAFDGEIDEIRFFDRALGATEVLAVFNAGADGNCRPCTLLPHLAASWWRAEDNGDDAVADNNGVLDNGAGFGDGIVGRAFTFDGSNDVVRLPDSDLWDFGTASFAIAGWFKTTTPGYRNIARYHNGGSGGSWGLRMESAGKVQFLIIDQSGGLVASVVSDQVFTDGVWHHVIAVRDSPASLLRLFIDGIEATTPVIVPAINVVGAADAKAGIGAGQWGSTTGTFEPFAGAIDEVAIFTDVPDQAQIERLYNAGRSGFCGSCVEPAADQVGWWRGEGDGFDSAGGHHGTAMNNATFAPALVASAIALPDGGDFVEVPHSADLSFGPTEPMTIELWAWRATDQDAQHIFSKRFDCYSTPWNYQLVWHQSANQLCFGSNAGGYVCSTPDKLPLQQWTHLAVRFDGAIATIIVNGDPVASAAMQLGPDTNNPPLRFGSVADCAWADQGFNGMLDEIQIFDRALSLDEIRSSHAAGRWGHCRECAPTPAGLAAWWRGEGDPQDTIGDNHGTEINGAGYGSGVVGRAFSFDDGASPGYIEVPHSASLDITGPFSAEGWVHTDVLPDALLVAKADADGTVSASSYALDITSGTVRSVLYGTSPEDVRSSGTPVDAGEWRHIAVTWDGSTSMPDNVHLYIDGRLTDTWTKMTGLNSTVESLTIGAMKPPTYHLTTGGRIDELALYAAELTAAEVAEIYRAGGAGKCVPVDTIPDPFVFSDQVDVELATVVTSNAVAVTGIDAPTGVEITSCTSAACEYSVNGGTWVSGPGLVAQGDLVQVRQTSSSSFATTTDLTLSIGGVDDTFSVTTWPGRRLTVDLDGIGRGTVTSAPAGIDCPTGACAAPFDDQEPVTLTPTAADGSAFAGWSGDSDCDDGSVTMTGDISCTATFDFLGLFADGFETGDTTRWDAASP